MDLKGRVWIAANTLQLMHLETELVRPMPEIKLLVHHQSIDYGGVAFPAKHAELWLPKSTVLYFHFRGYRYRRSNTLKGFRLFSVESSQKDSAPKQ